MLQDGSSQRHARVRSRPVRVAYLVELSESSHPIIDAIIAASKLFWGGRFSLIVPCKRGKIRESYRQWLAEYDADVVYSYVDLSEKIRSELHEELYPSFLVRHRMYGDGDTTDYRNFRPDLPIEPLSISTIVPILARRSNFTGERTLKVLNASGSFAQSPFFRDSFGVEIGGLSNDLNGRLSEFGNLWMLSDPDPKDGSVQRRDENEKRFSSIPEMLAAIGRNHRVMSALQLAAALTARTDQRDRRWSWSFNLIVGDSITDRIVYWNSRILFPPWRDGDQVDLRVPTSLLADSHFVQALHKYIAELPSVSGDNSGGPPSATIRSNSLSAKKISRLKDELANAKGWVHYRTERIDSVDACVPKSDERSNLFLSGPHGLSTGSWSDERTGSDSTIVRCEPPDHLKHCPVTLQSVREGVWAVDLDIERTVDYSPYTNVRDTWRLPRRLRTTGSFVRGYQLDQPHGRILMPRVSRDGFLTLYSGGSGQLPAVAEPTDESAIRGALITGRDWWHFSSSDEKQPAQLCYEAERSNAGRYFWGVFRLFGDLQSANQFLSHGFWREQLARLGATDQRPEQRRAEIEARLKRRLPGGTFDLQDASNLERLSDIVLQEADAIRLTENSLDWPQLQRDHERYIEMDWANAPSERNLDKEEWQGWERASLGKAVRSLSAAGILHQGLEYGCPRCHHNVWLPIAELGPIIVCEICGRKEPAPVDRPWQFRLNGFLRDALRRHGIGPLFWALGRMQRMQAHRTHSFWFEGPLKIYRTKADFDAHRVSTDIDLTVIQSGVVRMCEVKQSGRHLAPDTLAETFKRLRPDIATIAIMEPATSAIQAKYARFTAALAGSGIEPELLTFDPDRDLEDRAFLGELETVRVL